MKADRFVIRPKVLVAFASLTLLPLAAGVAAQQEPKPNPYPEHGQVIATRLGAEAVGSADSVGSLKRWIYRVDCGGLYYDLQGGRKRLSPSARMLHSELKSKEPIWTTAARTANVIALSEPVSPTRSGIPNQTRTRRRARVSSAWLIHSGPFANAC
jgi:hypothetical protein